MGQPRKVAMFGIKLKALMKSGTLYDLNGSHSPPPPASSQSLNGGRSDRDPHWSHKGSVLKGCHVCYQTEGFEEIWNII